MDRALFVRHGESVFSEKGLVNGDPRVAGALSPLGRQQARQLGERLTGEPIELCIVTEFPRTVETADLILGGRPVPRLVLPELNDPYYGSFEGGPLSEYRKWAATHGPEDAPPGGGESRLDIARRYLEGYRIVLARSESTVLVVCHSLPIAFALAGADGRSPKARMPLITYAEPYAIYSSDLQESIEHLQAWIRNPVYT